MAAILITTLFLGCSKDKAIAPLTENLTITPEQVSVQKIKNFLYRTKNPSLCFKTDKYYSSSEVFNLIGATLNYVYSFPTENVKDIEWVEQTINIPISLNSGILESDAIAAYSSAILKVRESFRSINKSDKHLLAVYIKDLVIETSSSVQLQLISQIGSSTNLCVTGFDDTDEYYYKNDSYRCDETGEEGAPNILEQMIYFKYKTIPEPGWHIWYWPQTVYNPQYGDFNAGNTIDNFCDYKIFFADESVGAITSETTCLGYNQSNSGINEMDFYLNGADEICNGWLTSLTLNPGGYNFSSCTFTHFKFNTQIGHILNFTFGKRNAVKEEGEENDYPIMID